MRVWCVVPAMSMLVRGDLQLLGTESCQVGEGRSAEVPGARACGVSKVCGLPLEETWTQACLEGCVQRGTRGQGVLLASYRPMLAPCWL